MIPYSKFVFCYSIKSNLGNGLSEYLHHRIIMIKMIMVYFKVGKQPSEQSAIKTEDLHS